MEKMRVKTVRYWERSKLSGSKEPRCDVSFSREEKFISHMLQNSAGLGFASFWQISVRAKNKDECPAYVPMYFWTRMHLDYSLMFGKFRDIKCASKILFKSYLRSRMHWWI